MDFQYLELGDEPAKPEPDGVLDFLDLCRIAPPEALLRRFSLAFCDRYRWLPLQETGAPRSGWLPAHVTAPTAWPPGAAGGRVLQVAMESPGDTASLKAIALRSGRRLLAVPSSAESLDRFLAERYPGPANPKGGFMRR